MINGYMYVLSLIKVTIVSCIIQAYPGTPQPGSCDVNGGPMSLWKWGAPEILS